MMSASVYYAASANGQGTELWRSDGTIAGTVQVGGLYNAGVTDADSSGLDPTDMTTLDEGVLFVGNDSYGGGPFPALWVSDGSAAGTYEIGGIANQGVEGALLGFYVARFLVGFGGEALFTGADTADQYGLWVTDGSTAGTTEIGGPNNAGIAGKYATGWNPANYVAVGDKVFFDAFDSYGYEGLWVTDGTAAGTLEIGGLDNSGIAHASKSSYNVFQEVAFGDDLLYAAPDSSGKDGLWVSDGTASGTVEIGASPQLSTFYQPEFAVAGPIAYFVAADSTAAAALWVTNGTAAGTYEVGGLENAGVNGVTSGLTPILIATFGSRAVFAGIDPEAPSAYSALWVSDGTAVGTYEVGGLLNAGVNGAAATFGLDPKAFASLGSVVVFTGYDRSGHLALWATDGTAPGTIEIGGLNNAGVAGAYAGGLAPTSFVVSGGQAYFSAEDADEENAIFVTDGTLAGTHDLTASAQVGNDPSLTATALGSNIYAGGGCDVTLAYSANNTAYLENTGTDLDYVYGVAGAVSLTSAQTVVAGEGNTVDFQSSSGNIARLRNTSLTDNVFGSGGTVFDLLGGPVSVSGGDDLIVCAGSTGSDVTLTSTNGAYDTVRRNPSTLNLNDAQTVVGGGGFTVNFDGEAANAARLRVTFGNADTVNGSNGTAFDVGSQVKLAGADDLMVMIGTSQVNATSGHDVFTVRDTPGNVTIGGFAATDVLRLSTSEFADWQALSQHIGVVGGNTVITYAADETVTLLNFSALNQSEVRFL